jgi:hypothetical protein
LGEFEFETADTWVDQVSPQVLRMFGVIKELRLIFRPRV